jgi:hypothetical protein
MFRKDENLKNEYLKAFKDVVKEFENLTTLVTLTENEQSSFKTLSKIIDDLSKAENASTQLVLINDFLVEKEKLVLLLNQRKKK